MPKATPRKTGQLHLIFSAKTGFQYYYTLPTHFAAYPQLPRQVRWSLGHDEALARELAQYLNERFSFLRSAFTERALEHSVAQVLNFLTIYQAEVGEAVQRAGKSWQGLPTPAELARRDLTAGYERLLREGRQRPLLYTTEPGGEIIFALTPSVQLARALGMNFTRFDWPLGTRAQAELARVRLLGRASPAWRRYPGSRPPLQRMLLAAPSPSCHGSRPHRGCRRYGPREGCPLRCTLASRAA